MVHNDAQLAATSNVLEVRDLAFSYDGETCVLRGADLVVPSGTVVGLLGSNGAGKTTMLGAITDSIIGERTGSIRIGGSEEWVRSAVGFATQSTGLYSSLTVLENLEHMARLIVGRNRAKSQASDAVDEFGLSKIAGLRGGRLSGGQRRLAHLACTMVHQPRLRLLDEPTTALDFETRSRIIDLVGEWARAGDAVVITGHYPEDIEDTCSRVTVLHKGRTTDLGDLRTLMINQLTTLEITSSAFHDVVVFELADATAASIRNVLAQFDDTDLIMELKLQTASLRTLLRRDPSLASLLELAAAMEENPRCRR